MLVVVNLVVDATHCYATYVPIAAVPWRRWCVAEVDRIADACPTGCEIVTALLWQIRCDCGAERGGS